MKKQCIRNKRRLTWKNCTEQSKRKFKMPAIQELFQVKQFMEISAIRLREKRMDLTFYFLNLRMTLSLNITSQLWMMSLISEYWQCAPQRVFLKQILINKKSLKWFFKKITKIISKYNRRILFRLLYFEEMIWKIKNMNLWMNYSNQRIKNL